MADVAREADDALIEGAPPEDDSNVSSEGDGITVVLDPDDSDDEEQIMDDGGGAELGDAEVAPSVAEGSAATPGAPMSGGGDSRAGTATPASAAANTRHRKYVNPLLEGTSPGPSGTPTSGAAVRKAGGGFTAAQKAKLGPLVHVPGAQQIDLDTPPPDNIDIDQLADKPWHKPEVDLTDYFNCQAPHSCAPAACSLAGTRRSVPVRAPPPRIAAVLVPLCTHAVGMRRRRGLPISLA